MSGPHRRHPRIRVERRIDAPAGAAWELLTDLDRWPEWGPSVRSARLDGDHFVAGATGRVRTTPGPELGFEITTVEPGRRWSWKVAGIPATDHEVDPIDGTRCVVAFGVPPLAAPYAIVCRRALTRIERLLTADG